MCLINKEFFMGLMDSLLGAAASALGNSSGNSQQNTAIELVMQLIQQSGGVGNLSTSCNRAAWRCFG